MGADVSFATRLSDLPTELVREVLERLVSNDAEAACVALTKFCSASRRTGRVCDDGVWASAYEELFAIEPDENPKAELRSVCSDLSRLSDEFRVAFMKNNKSWNELELNRARARIVALQGEGALTDLLTRRGATSNITWSDYKLADHELRRSTYDDEDDRARSALENGADPNGVLHDEPVLVMAADWGALAVLKLLLDSGADIDATNGIESSAATATGTMTVPVLHATTIQLNGTDLANTLSGKQATLTSYTQVPGLSVALSGKKGTLTGTVDVPGLDTTLAGKQATLSSAADVPWLSAALAAKQDALTGIADVPGLTTALAGKQSTLSGTSDVPGLDSALAGKQAALLSTADVPGLDTALAGKQATGQKKSRRSPRPSRRRCQ